MRLVVLGPPGAGKSTHAEVIARRFGIPRISPGDILREDISKGASPGAAIEADMDKGGLAPDDLVIRLVEARLNEPDAGKGFVLEGFPRSLPQAEALDKFLEKHGHKLDAVIDIEVSDAVIIKRISGRRICDSCGAIYNIYFDPPRVPGVCDVCGGRLYRRADDTEETVRNRIAVYDKLTRPVLDHYRKQGILITIDGDKEIDRLSSEIIRSLEMMIYS
jgi:adenylate kinase